MRSVVADYVTAIRIPLPAFVRPGERATAFAALGVSVLALLSIELLGVSHLLLVPPLLGILASGVAAWRSTPARDPAVSARREIALRSELETLADSRVALVIRQFEWAVNDVERLRQTLRRAEAAKLAADKHATELELRNRQFRSMVEQAQAQLAAYRAEPLRLPQAERTDEAPSTTLSMRWSLHEDGAMQWLHLETEDAHASRVRLLDPEGHLLTISDPAEPASLRSDGPLGFILAMSVPADVIGEVASDSLTHRFEALVREEWVPVTLSDSGMRTGTSRDKRSRFYVADAARSIA